MKLSAYIMIIAMLILNLACSSSNNLENSSYIPPSVKYQPRLIYPTSAQENLLEGKPVIMIEISDKGSVVETKVLNSSGYEILDDAAIYYCENLVFNPAQLNNKPSHSRLKIGIDFQLDDYEFSPKEYVYGVKTLYKEISVSSKSLRKIYKDKIFQKHTAFVENMKDALNFNHYMSNVLQEDLVNSWDSVWNSWPLSFLVFHDFLNRYPDYADSSKVKERLHSALKEDIKYIRLTPSDFGDKEVVFGKIISFMKKEYPELDIDDINFELNKIEQPNI